MNLINWQKEINGICNDGVLEQTYKFLLFDDSFFYFVSIMIYRFSTIHVLSDADETWSGLRGRIDGEMLQSFLPTRRPQEEPKCFAFVCGPTAFTQLTRG